MVSWVDVNGWATVVNLSCVCVAHMVGEKLLIRLTDGNAVIVYGDDARTIYERIRDGQPSKLGSIQVKTSFSGGTGGVRG